MNSNNIQLLRKVLSNFIPKKSPIYILLLLALFTYAILSKENKIEINNDYQQEVDGVSTDAEETKQTLEEIINNSPDTEYTVSRVVDGDTVVIENVGTVRLIGIDTPETVDPRQEVECFGLAASNKAKELLEGKRVRLEFDSSQGSTDKYGRILAYIFTQNNIFFNLEMIKQGYANEYTYSTPYKYQQSFKETENLAREQQMGLWGVSCN